MRNRGIVFLLILLIASASSLNAVLPQPEGAVRLQMERLNDGEITIDFKLNDLEIRMDEAVSGRYYDLSMPGERHIDQPGLPELPFVNRLLAIPAGLQPEIRIEIIEQRQLEDVDFLIQTDCEGCQETLKSHTDNVFLPSEGSFPSRLWELGEEAVIRGVNVIPLNLYPLQYDPETRVLTIIDRMSIDIDLPLAYNNQRLESAKPLSRAFEPVLAASVLNYQDLLDRNDEYQQPCYLFIYASDALLSLTGGYNLQDVINWKKQKGFDVHTANAQTIGVSTTAIKNYIQNAYDNWENPPEYVCLVGDPGSSFNLPCYSYSWGATDHNYALLDGADVLADVMIGRLSVDSETDMKVIANKIINYEKQPFLANTEWFTDVLLVGDPSQSGPSTISTCKYVKETILNYSDSFTFNEYYSGNYASGFQTSMNNGVSYFVYRGYIGMSGIPSYISSLNNGWMMPFVACLTCATGGFDGESTSEAFLEAGTVNLPRAAIAAVGTATSSTHTCYNNAVTSGMYHGIFQDGIQTPGGALVRGKLALYQNYQGSLGESAAEPFYYWNNLMGDPGLELWTGLPAALNVAYESSIPIGTNNIWVSVQDEYETPIPDAWVTAWNQSLGLSVTGFTDETGLVVLPLETSISGVVTLTVTAHDKMPHIGSITIQQTGSFISLEDYTVDDDDEESSGNGDGLLNPGETIELQVSLKNHGMSEVQGVYAVLSCDDYGVTITDSLEIFGNMPFGSIITCEDDFDFVLAEDLADQTELEFRLAIFTGDAQNWEESFFITVYGPEPQIVGYNILNGGNNFLDPGETSEISFTLNNLGTATVSDIYGELIFWDDRIIVNDSLGFFGALEPGQPVENSSDTYSLTAGTQILPGSLLPGMIRLFNQQGYQHDINFSLQVGEAGSGDPLGPDAYGYYIFDDDDAAYSLCPVYIWIEIDPDMPGYDFAGTVLNLNDSGETGSIVQMDLPPDFNFRFYGEQYETMTVCSNGFLTPGYTENYEFMNWHIPGPQGPNPMIAAFWDDLIINYSGNVCYYYNQEEHYLVVEWNHALNQHTNSEETFQIIIYDADHYPTITNDCAIKFQYKVVNNNDQGSYPSNHGLFSTVGIVDHTNSRGLEYTCDNQYPAAAKPLSNEMALLITTNLATAVDPPVAQFSADSFTFAVMQGDSYTQHLQITNNGEANLYYQIHKYYDPESSQYRGSGGPDNYGYIWVDSNEEYGPEFSWRDISAVGQLVSFSHNDVGTDLIPLEFTFNFYGVDYDQFRINPNGWIGFGADNTEWQNTAIPDSDAPRPAILTFWDDLRPWEGEEGGGNVYYYSTTDSLVVWFDHVIHYVGDYNGTYDFQTIIYPDGSILNQYRTVSGDIDTNTIGIQNAEGNDGLQVVFNDNYVENNLAVAYHQIIDWLEVTPLQGVIASGQTAEIAITAESQELETGNYHCRLLINTNDPNADLVEIPVDLSVVTELPDINIDTEFLAFGEVLIGTSGVDTILVSNFGLDTLYVTSISADLEVFNAYPASLDLIPGAEAEVYVTFTPQEAGDYSGILYLESNDPDESLIGIPLSGTGYTDTSGEENDVPLVTALGNNHPNPFNPDTIINFSLHREGLALLEIYNLKGQLVRTLYQGVLAPGIYNYLWDGTADSGNRVSSGLYLYRLQTADYEAIRKMILIK